ncbi:DUF927 domain-containing protein [Bacillus sp. AFS015896]|uniref:DUF927 domain-containing protein n=1 Tax=Bacillus sp. AFS015896 TaxID=2033487 RepID=UPI000BF89ED6|nr:DUF927 domain-containing protein [Bacillus sp. AFS015896]PFA56101.1 hypothetical protein CN402_24555 [Bacillus sp. AFS015896]
MTLKIVTKNYKCNQKGVYKWVEDEKTSKGNWVWISRAIYLSKLYRKIDTDEVLWEVTFSCNDGWQSDVISRRDVTEQKFTALMAKGADVTIWKTKIIIDYLLEQEQQVPVDKIHEQVGWLLYDEKHYFSQNQLISLQNQPSKYVGEYNIFSKGTFDDWLLTINKYVVGNPSLELALSMGFSAVLVGYINKFLNIHADSLIFHICGNSTTGKTTAAMVAVSGFGDPKEGPKSLIQSFNGTDNALTKVIANNNGMPIVCDETSLATMGTKKLVNVLYTWAKNLEKARLNKDSVQRERASWATTIITTGEGSLIDQVNQNEGMRARVFEFQNIQWTNDATQAKAINHSLSNNYGQASEIFVKKLLSYTKTFIQKSWEYETEQMALILPDSKFNDRISKKFALIIMAAKLINEVFEINLDVEAIRELLVLQEIESLEERLIGPKAHEMMREWLLKNQKHFYINKEGNPENQTIWGRIDIDKKNKKTQAYILSSDFKRMLVENGFSDVKVVLRELDAMGVLIKEKDSKQNKYHTRRVIKGEENTKNGVQVYGIEFDGRFIYQTSTPLEVSKMSRKGIRNS